MLFLRDFDLSEERRVGFAFGAFDSAQKIVIFSLFECPFFEQQVYNDAP